MAIFLYLEQYSMAQSHEFDCQGTHELIKCIPEMQCKSILIEETVKTVQFEVNFVLFYEFCDV